MNVKDNCKIQDLSLNESLKVVRKTVSAIRVKIIYLAGLPEKSTAHEQSMIECIYGVLSSQSHLLKYIYYHAKSSEEILEVKQTQDLVVKTCEDLKKLNQGISIKEWSC